MDLESTGYSPETEDTNEIIDRKLREHFDGKIVRKDLHHPGSHLPKP